MYNPRRRNPEVYATRSDAKATSSKAKALTEATLPWECGLVGVGAELGDRVASTVPGVAKNAAHVAG